MNFVGTGFGVLTAKTACSTVFWDVYMCSLVEVLDILEEYIGSIFRIEE
jgi:hypothetical protein